MKRWYVTKINSKFTWELEEKLAEGWEPFSTTSEKVSVETQLQPVRIEYLWLRIYK